MPGGRDTQFQPRLAAVVFAGGGVADRRKRQVPLLE